MFTGIIKDTGEVARIEEKSGICRVHIGTHFDVAAMEIGASIACDGCCLTVVDKEGGCFVVEVSNETLAKTTIGRWAAGTKINLEQSLKVGDELGGHLVTGHVDGLATLESVQPDGDSYRLRIKVPAALASYIAPKGSVALNGISLTVNEVEGEVFGVNIIPHTWDVTTLHALRSGDTLNIEVDMMARYVARILDYEREQAAA